MAKLKAGALTIDLIGGGIYGDLDHCPKEDLLESAQALLSILPKIKRKGVWALAKDYDAGCYVYTAEKAPTVPADLSLESDVKGYSRDRPFSLCCMTGASREQYWKGHWYSKVVGSIKDGKVTPDIEGVEYHYRPPPPPTVAQPVSRVGRQAKPPVATAQERMF